MCVSSTREKNGDMRLRVASMAKTNIGVIFWIGLPRRSLWYLLWSGVKVRTSDDDGRGDLLLLSLCTQRGDSRGAVAMRHLALS